MLQQLINLIRERSGEAIINNPAIPNERNEEAVRETGSSIMHVIQGALAGGGLTSLLKLFGGRENPTESPLTKLATGGVIENLVNKFGLNPQQAGEVAGKVVPDVMNDMVQKTNDPGDNSFNIQDIFNEVSGGKTSGLNIQSMLEKVKSGKFDLDGDGDTDLNDLKAILGGSGGGGLMDKVKGMFN